MNATFPCATDLHVASSCTMSNEYVYIVLPKPSSATNPMHATVNTDTR